MDKIEQVAHKMRLDQFGENHYIQVISEKTKLKPVIIVFGHVVVLALFILLTTVGRVLLESTLLFFYPAYKSFQALKSEESYDDRRWLTYWITFGFFYGFDTSLSFIFGQIPFWPFIRMGILLYIMHPMYGGSEIVYGRIIKPVLDKYDEHIDKYLDSAESKFQDFGNKAKKATAETISKNLLKTE